jgi:hypothetical protein
MKRWITKAQERQALAILSRQENAQERKKLSAEERNLLKHYFFAVDQESCGATERLQKSRGSSATARRLEEKLDELAPLWERLRKVIEEDEPPLGYMQGKGAS